MSKISGGAGGARGQLRTHSITLDSNGSTKKNPAGRRAGLMLSRQGMDRLMIDTCSQYSTDRGAGGSGIGSGGSADRVYLGGNWTLPVARADSTKAGLSSSVMRKPIYPPMSHPPGK